MCEVPPNNTGSVKWQCLLENECTLNLMIEYFVVFSCDEIVTSEKSNEDKLFTNIFYMFVGHIRSLFFFFFQLILILFLSTPQQL